MNTKYMVIVAVMTVMLIGATALATTDSAFAGGKKHYEKNQAISQECWMSKHCISDSGRRKRSVTSSRASISIRHR